MTLHQFPRHPSRYLIETTQATCFKEIKSWIDLHFSLRSLDVKMFGEAKGGTTKVSLASANNTHHHLCASSSCHKPKTVESIVSLQNLNITRYIFSNQLASLAGIMNLLAQQFCSDLKEDLFYFCLSCRQVSKSRIPPENNKITTKRYNGGGSVKNCNWVLKVFSTCEASNTTLLQIPRSLVNNNPWTFQSFDILSTAFGQ